MNGKSYSPAGLALWQQGQTVSIALQTAAVTSNTSADCIGSDRNANHNFAGWWQELVVFQTSVPAVDQAVLISQQAEASESTSLPYLQRHLSVS